MENQFISLIAILPPIACTLTAIVSWFQPGMRPNIVKGFATITTYVSLLVAAISCVLVYNNGLIESKLLGMNQIGFSIRLDSISVIMFTMIALLSFIIVKFSLNYLDGEKRQGAFIGRLAATIACVQLLVLSGNIGLLMISWILTSISLHRLLVFYPNRPGAIVVARKKFLLARLADASLFTACALLYMQFQTGNFEIIFTELKNHTVANVHLIELTALFITLAALIKSAQFPSHGWLIEVMETPTPVSALLHAGLLNAGPFLIIRMSYIMDLSTYAPILLIAIGGFTALFASVVYLTQTSVKTALGYSSVAHMGFSLFVCGLGMYAAAMLHLVAHSFYKAHAFLSSGSAIELKRGLKITPLKRAGSPFKIILGILMAVVVYTSFALLWGMNIQEQFALFAIGAILVLGLARLFTNAIDSENSALLLMRATILALIITTAFFVLESTTHYLIANQLPALVQPSLVEMVLIVSILLVYVIAVFIQILSPYLTQTSVYQSWAIHLRNGFYVNALFDRLVGALRIKDSKNSFEWKEDSNA
ncbi:proton-conducting transporter membrane subunit [uncultured Cytophaga sp.]|uniref:proton-conducting transporter transmembrane domain-containing protein n=1 Tax=uncultured Cytophaga sp. TaxID=160238 RepID=UPI00261AA4E5|nr:proton-conducting transporter membrane subunit [uncultured Cytophaga sp.]